MAETVVHHRLAELEKRNAAQDAELRELRAEHAEHVEDLEGRIERLRRDLDEKEKRLLWRGIMGLGALVSVLLGVIWNYRGQIFK
jgi:uncharacterized coiled-coil protein SlyX